MGYEPSLSSAAEWPLAVRRVRPSIRAAVGLAVLAIIAIVAAAGALGLHVVNLAGHHMAAAFDEAEISSRYAHAVDNDFAAITAAHDRQDRATDPAQRELAEVAQQELTAALERNLTEVAQRGLTVETTMIAEAVRRELALWHARRSIADRDWPAFSRQTQAVNAAIDRLIARTGEDAAQRRRTAHDSLHWLWQASAMGLGATLLLIGLIGLLLARHVRRTLAAASATAAAIAAGRIDPVTPAASRDELDDMLEAVATMQDNIRALAERQRAAQRAP